QRLQCRVQSEITIEIEQTTFATRTRNGNRLTNLIITLVSIGRHDVQSINRSPQEHDHELVPAILFAVAVCPALRARNKHPEGEQSCFQKFTSIHCQFLQ